MEQCGRISWSSNAFFWCKLIDCPNRESVHTKRNNVMGEVVDFRYLPFEQPQNGQATPV